MTRLIMFILSIIFLLVPAVAASAQEIYMNCKFFNGYYKAKGLPVENVNKDIDLSLVLNKTKKTVRSSSYSKDEKYSEYKDDIDWSDKYLSYKLNLINGNLTVFGEPMVDVFKSYNYQCEKTQKKF
jgi:hypothetical protein